jgi:gluconokinase
MEARTGHYMPLSLLDSQLAALEPLDHDEAGLSLDIRRKPQELVNTILQS